MIELSAYISTVILSGFRGGACDLLEGPMGRFTCRMSPSTPAVALAQSAQTSIQVVHLVPTSLAANCGTASSHVISLHHGLASRSAFPALGDENRGEVTPEGRSELSVRMPRSSRSSAPWRQSRTCLKELLSYGVPQCHVRHLTRKSRQSNRRIVGLSETSVGA